jgi:hypothetical protein
MGERTGSDVVDRDSKLGQAAQRRVLLVSQPFSGQTCPLVMPRYSSDTVVVVLGAAVGEGVEESAGRGGEERCLIFRVCR